MEIILTAENGRTLRVSSVVRDGDGSVASYDATLTIPGGSITTTVHEYGTWLPRFFRELADAWQGFDDVKSFGSLEGELTIEARHDGLGTVYCDVCLRQPWPPEWTLSAVWTSVVARISQASRMRSTSSSGSTDVPLARPPSRWSQRTD